MKTPSEVFNLGSPITDEEGWRSHPYLRNAVEKGLTNYRILKIEHLMRDLSLNTENLSYSLVKFILEYKKVLLVANIIKDETVFLVVRALEEKKFILYGDDFFLFYGMGNLEKGFKRNDWVIVVEGILDRDSIIDMYPYVLSVLSSGLSVVQRRILESLTKRVILMYDNDDTGRRSFFRDKGFLEKGGTVRDIKYPTGMKDFGNLAETMANGDNFDFLSKREYIKQGIDLIVKSY